MTKETITVDKDYKEKDYLEQALYQLNETDIHACIRFVSKEKLDVVARMRNEIDPDVHSSHSYLSELEQKLMTILANLVQQRGIEEVKDD